MDTMERLERLDEALTGHRAPPPSEDPPAQEGPTESRPLWRVIFSKNQFTSGGAIEVVGPETSKAAALDTLGRRLGDRPVPDGGLRGQRERPWRCWPSPGWVWP